MYVIVLKNVKKVGNYSFVLLFDTKNNKILFIYARNRLQIINNPKAKE